MWLWASKLKKRGNASSPSPVIGSVRFFTYIRELDPRKRESHPSASSIQRHSTLTTGRPLRGIALLAMVLGVTMNQAPSYVLAKRAEAEAKEERQQNNHEIEGN